MTMRPLNRNDGSVPSHRKRVNASKTSSFAFAGSPQSSLNTGPAADRNPGLCRLVSKSKQPTEAFMFYSGSSEESLSHKKPKDNEPHLELRSSNSSASATSSDSASSSSDCGKDLVKRKRYITIKTIKCEPSDVLSGDGIVSNDTASSGSSLTLVKNSASLIFTKKVAGSGIISNQAVVHRKRDTRVGRRSENRSSLQGIGEHDGAVGVETVLRKERTHSWYAPLYAPLDEEVDPDSTSVCMNSK